ncbi:MAG: recombinase family protein [Candidatus Dojkabacteria bacterium]|nr:recombinase family protein [Candidatus Dojkabacteria bacterium]
MSNEIIGIGYTRVSTKKQADEGVSLKIQKRDVEKKLKDLGCTKIFMYEDEGKSGRSIEGRDDFQKAVEKALKDKVKYFCTYDTSRFSRNTQEAIEVVRRLQKNNIELICVTAKFDDTPEGRLVFKMLASIDEYYSDSLGAKIKVSLQKKREQGYFMGKAPKGYNNIRVNNVADIVINDDGRAIQKTFQNYLAGKIETLREVARDLDINGFEPKKNTSFQLAGRILRTPFYAGMFWDSSIDDYREHVYQRLISKKDWLFIQEKLDGRKRQTNSYKKHHPDFPLRSITYCSHCGRKLRGYPARGNGGTYYVYACPTKGCFRATSTAVVHQEFGDTISHLEPDEGLLRLFEEILRSSLSEGTSKDNHRGTQLQKRIESLQEEQKTTIEAISKLNNEKVIEGLEKKYEQLEKEITSYEEDIESINEKLSEKNCKPVIENGLKYLKDPYSIWISSNATMKYKYQKWLFPDGIEYHPETGLRTRELCLTYQVLEQFKNEDSSMVETMGIEPMSKSFV